LRAFLFQTGFGCLLGVNCVDWTGIHACATIDAGISVDYALVTLLANGVNRARVLTSCAVGAIVGNGVSHGTTSLKNVSVPLERQIY
jgi:hypothetical protein